MYRMRRPYISCLLTTTVKAQSFVSNLPLPGHHLFEDHTIGFGFVNVVTLASVPLLQCNTVALEQDRPFGWLWMSAENKPKRRGARVEPWVTSETVD